MVDTLPEWAKPCDHCKAPANSPCTTLAGRATARVHNARAVATRRTEGTA